MFLKRCLLYINNLFLSPETNRLGFNRYLFKGVVECHLRSKSEQNHQYWILYDIYNHIYKIKFDSETFPTNDLDLPLIKDGLQYFVVFEYSYDSFFKDIRIVNSNSFYVYDSDLEPYLQEYMT